MARDSKGTINVLMNPSTYFGEHQGRLAPVVKFLLVSAAPAFILLVLPVEVYGIAIVLEILWCLRVALYVLGDEPVKMQIYLQSLDDEYATAEDMIRIVNIHNDGLIEYTNGEVMYVVSGYFATYQNDDALSVDLEGFLKLFEGFTYDIYCHNVVDEYKLQNHLESTRVYTDSELMKERIRFYMLQDEYCDTKSKLYRINIAVKAYKYNWKALKQVIDNAVVSDGASVFKFVKRVSDIEEVNDIISRDLGTNANLGRMLIEKYKNQNYYGSKVLFYGEEIPEKYQFKKESLGLENMRVFEEMQTEEQ